MKGREKIATKNSRRTFISDMGALVVSFPLAAPRKWLQMSPFVDDVLPRSLQRHPSLGAWLKLLEDNTVRVFTGKIELGQSIKTVIRQVAAEELCMDMDRVEVVMADTSQTPDEGYTAGSGSVKGSAMAVRYAAAFARGHLRRLAAEQWNLDKESVFLENGVVYSAGKERKILIKELLGGERIEIEVAEPVALISKSKYRHVGRPNRSYDLEAIVKGEPYFVQDLVFPDMLHARILRPPSPAWEQDFDVSNVKAMIPADMEVFIDGKMIAVLGVDEYQVAKIHARLDTVVKWISPQPLALDANFADELTEWVIDQEEVINNEVEKAKPGKYFAGTFYKPYIMHGAMGPACGIAQFNEGRLYVWTHSQGVFPFRSALASLFAMQDGQIIVKGEAGAGCFGHSSADDAATDAAILAKAFPGRYIRVQWTRRQEHQWEALGSAVRIDVKAALNAAGDIALWEGHIYTDSHSTRPNKDAGTLLGARYLSAASNMQGRGYLRGGHRNAEPYYEIGSKKLQAHYFEGPLRVSSLRSLGAFANIFAIETIIDQMSRHLGEHPVDFRSKRLADWRAVEVLKRLKDITQGMDTVDREGMGHSFGRYKNTDGYCAMAAKIKVSDKGEVSLIKFWAVVDVGEVMNPLGLSAQVEGAIIQAASWTLMESVAFKGGEITSDDWSSYHILKYDNIPDIEVVIVDRPEEPPLGGGELGTPPTAAAITNAIFDAVGVRIYRLPVVNSDLT